MKCRVCKSKFTRNRGRGRPRAHCSDACRQNAYRKRRKQTVLFSSKTCEWSTPPDAFAAFNKELGPFTLDVCATPENAKCIRYFTREQDGLRQTWTGRVWCNPPYGREIAHWLHKAWESVEKGDAETVVCLVPARTGAAWFQHYHRLADEVRFLPGRLRFGTADKSAPFDSVLMVFRNAKTVTKLSPKQRFERRGEGRIGELPKLIT